MLVDLSSIDEDFSSYTSRIARKMREEHGDELNVPVLDLLSHVFSSTVDSSPVSEELVLEDDFCADLVTDIKDLTMDTDEQSNSTKDYIFDESNASFYPPLEMSGSSVIVFPFIEVNEKVASFISNTSIAYRGINRNSSKHQTNNINFRVSLISCDDLSKGTPQIQAIDFLNNTQYWAFIAAISRNVLKRGGDNFWSGSGQCCNRNQEDILGGVSKFLGNLGANDLMQRIEVKGNLLSIFEQEKGQPKLFYSLNLETLKAITLSCDWHDSKPYVMEVSINCGSSNQYGGFSLGLLDSSLELLENEECHWKTGTEETTKILLPVAMREVQNGLTDSSLTSIAVLLGNKHNAAEEKSIGAIDTIPFNKFIRQSSNCDEDLKLLLQQPLIQNISISSTPSNKAVEVIIIGATELPLNQNGTEPSTYCAVYLLDSYGNRMGSKFERDFKMFGTSMEGEWKTDVIKTKTNPTWDTKLVMQEDGDVGIDGVTCVQIVVKEVSSRFGRPQHIGQVSIPVGCFVEGTPAQLTLPLEPSSKMKNNNNSSLGVIHVLTQCIRLRSEPDTICGINSASVTKTMYRARSSSVSKDIGIDNVPVKYNLKPASCDPLNVLWPFESLGGGLGSTKGHIGCGKNSLVVRLNSGTGGALSTCLEKSDALALSKRNAEEKKYFTISWTEVDDVIALTNSVLMMVVMVHNKIETKRRGSANTNSTPSPTKSRLELIIAPCPAKSLQIGILERCKTFYVRSELRKFQNTSNSHKKINDGSISSESIFSTAIHLTSVLDDQIDRNREYENVLPKSIPNPFLSVVITGASSNFSISNSKWANKKKNNTTNISSLGIAISKIITPAILSPHEISIINARTRIRSHLYWAQLMHFCKGLSINQIDNPRNSINTDAIPSSSSLIYTSTAIHEIVKFDLESISQKAASITSSLATELFEKHSMILKEMKKRLMTFILRSMDAKNDEMPLKNCIQILLSDYINTLREEFSIYLGSPEVYKRTPGQEAKIMLLQMIIFSNDSFHTIVAGKSKS